ncbi:hypothetical protein GCM10010253_11210 [Streptomyces badius]|uniref:Uncharacterized protein n=1 Tax=Streptomyces badius TaxID=1941 RepID=A0ABQ2SSR9_STRBA|nr:hypothetical protein GCM10010253_11210 [Streptomyces badius]
MNQATAPGFTAGSYTVGSDREGSGYAASYQSFPARQKRCCSSLRRPSLASPLARAKMPGK